MRRFRIILFCVVFCFLCISASPFVVYAAKDSEGIQKPGEGSYTMGAEKENDERGKMGTDFYVYIANPGETSETEKPPGPVYPGDGALPKTGHTGQTAQRVMLLALLLGAGYLLSDCYEKKIKTCQVL